MEREYKTIKALQAGETVECEGFFLKKDNGDIQPGDLYIGERNTGPKLLIAREILNGAVFATDYTAYPFDIWECIKVVEA